MELLYHVMDKGIDTKMKGKFKLKFNRRFICAILAGICLNMLGRLIAENFVIPFWLDAIGTCVSAIVAGPLAGAITGLCSNLIFSMGNIESLGYVLINMTVGIVVGIFYPDDRTDYFQIMYTAMLAAILVVVFATPLNMIYYHGYTGNVWGDALYDMLGQNGKSTWFHAVVAEGFVDIPDKLISLVIATGILKLFNVIKGKMGGVITNEEENEK